MGQLKLHFDGASKGNPGQAGFGCLLRDHDGVVVRVVPSLCVTIKAEVMGLLMEMRELKRMVLARASLAH